MIVIIRRLRNKEVNVELIPINDSKLKIMLDESDMKELHICDEADCACGETRLAIRTLLERAKTQVGFNTEGSEIFVQLYTSRGGGCELFVTKSTALLSSGTEGEHKSEKKSKKRETHQKRTVEEDCRAPSQSPDAPMDQRRERFGKMIFSFESLRDICAVCKILNQKNTNISSRAYRGANEEFYLVLENTNMSAYSRLDSMTFILEFGKRERADHINTYLCEHGQIICSERALETLSQF